ncbi:signal recognition particle-docking protein FtsY [Thalassospiraceae bacterium LMO-SO8]|nr:signal recognition particle-docking protein FtsY [Alphaproteobacteria bacterium LMO-S08]WND74402.1 signal recognition particle-docking protein FtsY [Thalassospiraceae bacterium LMO-SO8]
MAEERQGWLSRLRSGLSKSADRVGGAITDVFTKRKLDQAALDELEEILIRGDLGVATAARLTTALAKGRFDKEVTDGEVREALADEIAVLLAPVAQPLAIDGGPKPFVLLVCGVNGSGKTTTIGKLAAQFKAQGKSVLLAAGDTFRAAAIEQLQVWGERTGCPVVARAQGADPAGLAFDAVRDAREQGHDIVIIDTAGRLQNKKDLMAELEKVVRVIKKQDETAPHACLLVMDATIGQNAHAQVEAFKDAVEVTGLVMTKLDGSAKGGVVVALAEKFGLPVHAVGVGEGIDDLKPFEARAFARSLMGLDG